MNPTLADRMGRLGTETAFAVSADCAALSATGVKTYPFHLGDMNLATPSTVIQGAMAAVKAGKTGYCPSAGIPELRQALAEDVGASHKVHFGMENVALQPGGKPVIGKLMMARMNPGDRVIYPNPGYPIYESQIEFHGGIAHPYGYLDTPQGLRLDFAAIEAGFEQGARIFIYNNYHNPTGATSPMEEMERAAKLCVEYDALCLSDEAYFDIRYEGQGRSICALEGMRERTLILYTFSKKFAMTGWRLGAAIGPEWLIKAISMLNVNDESCTNHFIQYGALAGLRGPQEEVRALLEVLRERRDATLAGLRKIEGVAVHTPPTTFYVWPDVTGLMERKGFDDVEAFRRAALTQTGVSFCGRHHFGRPQPDEARKYIRLAYSGIEVPEIEAGLELLREWGEG